MRKLLIFTIIFYFIYCNVVICFANNKRTIIIYFYSTTCSSCNKINSFLESIAESNKNAVELRKYNIINIRNKNLLAKYNEAYQVIKEDENIVPIVFIKNEYLSGANEIEKKLNTIIYNEDELKTIEFNSSEIGYSSEYDKFRSVKLFTVFGSGLINGFNPCSLSMMLFFISIFITKRKNIFFMSCAFVIGKFFAFLILGLFLYKVIESTNILWLHNVTKYGMLVLMSILLVLNFKDFLAAKKEQYNKISLQLPTKIRKFNHYIIKRLSNIVDINVLILCSFSVGFFIAFGEFLCTGQVYLATIVTIINSNVKVYEDTAILYLLVYTFAFVIPLIGISYIIYKGKEIFEVSEVIRERLVFIKIINIILFLAYTCIILRFY